jgi:hypothetical protein
MFPGNRVLLPVFHTGAGFYLDERPRLVSAKGGVCVFSDGKQQFSINS